MRRLWPIALLVLAVPLLALAGRPVDLGRLEVLLNGRQVWLGTITNTAGTPKDNNTTSVPFGIDAGTVLKLQCDAAAYWAPGVDAGSIVDAQSEKLQANVTTPPFSLTNNDTVVAVDSVSGTANCKVFLLQ